MEAIGVIAYHRDKMPTKVILDMNTGRRVDSNVWHLPRKWACTWTSTKFQPLWCSVKEPLSLTMLKKQEKNDVGDDDMDLYRLNWSTSALAVIGVHCNPASRRPPMHFLLHKALESSAINALFLKPTCTSQCTQRRLPTVHGHGVGVRVKTDLIVLLAVWKIYFFHQAANF